MLLEEDTLDYGDVFTPKKKADCKEECFHLAVGNGSPFWTYNKETKWCHFRVTSNTKQHTKFWSGNTDSSCSYSNGCGSKSNLLFFQTMFRIPPQCNFLLPTENINLGFYWRLKTTPIFSVLNCCLYR